MKKLLILLLALAMVFAFAACGQEPAPPADEPADAPADQPEEPPADEGLTAENIKIGFIFNGDEADEGYSYQHIQGVKVMQDYFGLDDSQIICYYNIPEDSTTETAARELAEAGCNMVFANSFGHEDYLLAVAVDYPDVQFCHATGYQAAMSGLPNMHNFFCHFYQCRYLSGIVAGYLTEDNTIGFTAGMPFAEVIGAYTAYYLGAKSVNPDVDMIVQYTNDWTSVTVENKVAQALIDKGVDVLASQTSTHTSMSTAEANGIYSISYNAPAFHIAPNACVAACVFDWSICYINAVQCLVDGEPIPVDWTGSLADGMCDLVINEDLLRSIAPDQADEIIAAVATAKQELIDGDRYVYDTSTWTVNGETITTTVTDELGAVYFGAEYILTNNGITYFAESEYGSSPSFQFIVDGVTIAE